MDRERLTRLLEEPGRMAREDLDDLKALSQKFPWFSGAQLLRAVGDRAFGDVLADGSLERTAAHIPSRSVLFDLKDLSLSEAAKQLQAGTRTLPKEEGPQPEKFEKEEALTEQTDPIEDLAPQPGPVIDAEKEELDRQVLEAALASAYDLTWQERIIQSPIEGTVVQDEVSTRPIDDLERIADSVQKSSGPEIPIGTPPPPPVKITSRTRLKFSDWLSIEASSSPMDPPAIGERTEPVTMAPSLPSSKPSLPKLDPKDLIDRFIQTETPPPARKTEFFTPQSAAKKSLDDSAGLVSETLARIYEKQGNFQKAMDAYNKLALKYPEKSAYFAALSKELEGKMNA